MLRVSHHTCCLIVIFVLCPGHNTVACSKEHSVSSTGHLPDCLMRAHVCGWVPTHVSMVAFWWLVYGG